VRFEEKAVRLHKEAKAAGTPVTDHGVHTRIRFEPHQRILQRAPTVHRVLDQEVAAATHLELGDGRREDDLPVKPCLELLQLRPPMGVVAIVVEDAPQRGKARATKLTPPLRRRQS